MAKKVLLTTEQHQKLINHIVSEVITNSNHLVDKNGVINEGVWEKVKYGLSKLGRYKADGKIFGKGKTDQEAGAKIQSIIDKQGNELIKNLNNNIKTNNPEFPNNEKGNDFLNTIMEIAGIYDSIIAGVKQGTIPPDAANGVINDLRDYVKKFLDVDLTAAYSVVDEIKGSTLELTEEEVMDLDEAWGIDEVEVQMPKKQGNDTVEKNGVSVIKPQNTTVATTSNKGEPENKSEPVELFPGDTRPVKANSQLATTGNKGLAKTSNVKVSGMSTAGPNARPTQEPEDIPSQDVHNAKDVRSKLQAKKGSGADFASTRMDTLKSNKLPMTLVGIGASLGAFSWLVNTDWFKHLFDVVSKTPSVEMINQTVANNTEIIGNIKPGQGLTQLMNSMNNAGITPNTTPEQFLEQVKILGGGDINAGINALAAKGGIFVNPDAAKSVLTDIAQNPNSHGNTLGQIFKGKWSGTGKSVGDMLTCRDMGQVKGLIAGTLTKAIPTIVMKSAVKAGAGYAAAKGLGAILGPIGLAAVGTGALIKLMRMKGQKQSRAKTLNDLYQSLRNVEGGTGIIKPETELVNINQSSEPNQLGNGETKAQLGNDKIQGQLGGNDLQNQLSNKKNKGELGYTQSKEIGSDNTGTPEEIEETNIDETFNKLTNLFKYILNLNALQEIKPNAGKSRFIKNKNLLKFLNKEIGNNKLMKFERILNNLIDVRNSIKGLKLTGNDVTDNIINKLKNNPIIYTNFDELYNINDESNFMAVKNEILDLFNKIYSREFKNSNLISKLLKNQTDLNEMTNIKKEANNRKNFNKNVLNFLSISVRLYSTIVQSKKPKYVQGELFENIVITKNNVIDEHVERIKKIMYS